MPQQLTGLEYDTSYVFKQKLNRDPRNRIYILLDFRTSGSPGMNVQASNETINNSQIVVLGEDVNWVRAAYSKIMDYLRPKKRGGLWIHKAGIYDLLLMTMGVLFVAWVMTLSVPLIDRIFSGKSNIYIYSGYIFSFLLALKFFMMMFNYARLMWPIMEYKENSAITIAHRFIWSTIILGVIAGVIKDLLF